MLEIIKNDEKNVVLGNEPKGRVGLGASKEVC